MKTRYTEADFEHLSWHDCHIWGLDLHVGDPDEDDWTSDFVFDIDFAEPILADKQHLSLRERSRLTRR